MNSIHNMDLNHITDIPPRRTVKPLKNSGLASSIEKPSKVLKSSSLGIKSEIFCSIEFHEVGIPMLVSSVLLRLRDLGQIDLARLKKDQLDWVLEIAEVKSSEMGKLQMEKNQKIRLMHTQKFLSSLLGHRTKLICMTKNIK